MYQKQLDLLMLFLERINVLLAVHPVQQQLERGAESAGT